MKTRTKYTVDYFIKKFSKIPSSKWCVGKFVNDKGQKCALGHCGWKIYSLSRDEQVQSDAEGDALNKIVEAVTCMGDTAQTNDGLNPNFQQKTPRARILAVLRQFKKQEANRGKKKATAKR